MKQLLATTAILVALTGLATAQQTLDRTQEYRLWSAEQMIKRVADKLARSGKACDRAEWVIGQRLSEKCIASVVGAYPIIGKIREIARGGDPVQWANLIDAVHQFEADLEEPLNTLERR